MTSVVNDLARVEDQTEEVRRLRGCINDLMSLLVLPALWSGRKPADVACTLLDVLVKILHLDFAYARLNTTAGDPPKEFVRAAGRDVQASQAREVGLTLEPSLTPGAAPGSRCSVPVLVPDRLISIAQRWLGTHRQSGVVVAGSQRTDFPTPIETLLLGVAVNQAIVELQRAQVLEAHGRADEIEGLKNQLHTENVYLRQELDTEANWDEVVGHSAALRKVLALVEQVAPTNACVLVQGETGTGKELIARAVHRLSGRKDRPFVKLNCAAIPTGLLESELFGHERGAFTGAVGQKIGRFELAHRGTMFLDEVGDIPLELQAKLLRVLQEQEFERLGSTRTIRVDVRLVAASNRDLAQMVVERSFRSDLYYRLKVFPTVMPSLRERPEDIPLLVRHFTKRYAREFGKSISSIASETMTALCRYRWPGNIRELENFIERSVILSRGSILDAPLGELLPVERPVANSTAATTLESIEHEHIRRALEESNWVIAGPSGAAAKLGMKRTSLQYKMQKLGIMRHPAS